MPRVMVSWSSPSGDLAYTWCPFLSVTPEKEMQMCRGVVGQPSLPKPGVRSRKLSGDKSLKGIDTSSPLCILGCGFYPIMHLFRLTRCLSVQKRDETVFSGFLRGHSEITHFPLHWTASAEALRRALGCIPSWGEPEPYTGSGPAGCKENLPKTVWLA